MSLLIPLLVIGAVILAGLAVLSTSQGTTSNPSAPTQPTAGKETHTTQSYTYSCQKSLFTRAELTFYRALREATTDRYHVFGKVRVADVLKPQTKNRGDWQRAFNKISAKHFDFVLCDRDRLNVLAAIELDDSSHQRVDRVKCDDFLNQAVKSAGLPVIRFPVQTAYDREAIQHHIAQTLGQPRPEQTQPAPNQTAQPLGQLQPKQAQATPKPKPKPKPRPTQP